MGMSDAFIFTFKSNGIIGWLVEEKYKTGEMFFFYLEP